MEQTEFRRERLRFEEFGHETSQNGRALVHVVLSTRGARFGAEAGGVETREGSGRAAALAALAAAKAATGGRLTADLIGLKLVRAFDSWIVITALRAHAVDQSYRLIGSSKAPGEDTARGAVLSVLDAVNRVIEKYMPAEE